MKKYTGLLVGIGAGILDVIPMLVQKLPLEADLSAFAAWVVIGFFISRIEIGVKGALKGLVVAVLTVLPVVILIAGQDPRSLVPICVMTLLLGSLSGYLIERWK